DSTSKQGVVGAQSKETSRKEHLSLINPAATELFGGDIKVYQAKEWSRRHAPAERSGYGSRKLKDGTDDARTHGKSEMSARIEDDQKQ
ncbi:hypothetical protein HispidOSU_019677, partial [Sigmodon hispidus]